MADAGAVNLGSAYGEILIDNSKIDGQMNRTFDSVGQRFGKFFTDIGQGMQKTGASLTTLTSPLLAFGITGIRTAANFDDAMREIQARTGSTAEEMDALRETAIQMGADTIFSASEAAESMLQLMTSGFSANDALKVLPEVMNLAAASGADLGNTADWITDIMAQFRLETDQATEVVDALVRAAGSGSATVTDLAQGFQNAGGIANNFGLSVGETAAALQVFSENGIKGAEAGTQLKSMLTNMTRQTEAVQGTWSKLGVSMFDAEGNVRSLDDVIDDLNIAMDGFTEEERINTIQTLAGSYGQAGLTALLASDGIDTMQGNMEKAADAATVADSRMGGWNGAVEALMGSIETLQITVLTPLINNALIPMVKWITELVNGITEWAKENPVLAERLAKVLAIVSLLGPALFTMGTAITALVGAISPLTIFLGLFYLAFETNFLGIGDLVTDLISNLRIGFILIRQWVTFAIDAFKAGDFGKAFENLEHIFTFILPYLLDITIDRFSEFAKNAAEMIGSFVEKIEPFIPLILASLAKLSSALLGWIKKQAGKIVDQLVQWASAFIDWIAPMIEPALVALGGLTVRLIEWIAGQVPAVLTALGKWASAFIDWIAPMIEPALVALGGLTVRLIEWIAGQVPAVLTALGKWASAFIDWIAPMIGDLLLKLPKILFSILKWILDVLPDITVQLLVWATAFVDWVTPMIGKLILKLGDMLAAVINWILVELIPAITAEGPGITNALIKFVKDAVTQVGPKLLSFGASVVTGILGLGVDIAKAAWDLGASIGQSLIDGAKSLGSQLIDGINDMIPDNIELGSIGHTVDFGIFGGKQTASISLGTLPLPNNPIPGGSKDSGGRGRRGQQVLIGRGAQPELFTPDEPGTFTPANKLGGGGDEYNFGDINLNITPDMLRNEPGLRENANQFAEEFRRALRKDGGGLAGATT